MRSLALALDELVPGAAYGGSLTADDRAAYDALEWQDPRDKPSWAVVNAQRSRGAHPAELLAYAADARWRLETGGITVAGVPVLTDDRSKLMIAGARLAAMADPAWTTPWHGADGGIYPLDAAAIVAISDAVSAHVQASFSTFATVKAAIASGAITTTAEIEAAFAA